MDNLRSLPNSIEAEQSVIGCMIIDKSSILKALEALIDDDFYKDAHKVIFKTIGEMFEKDISVDMVTLSEYLVSKNRIDDCGGISYITQLANSIATTANLKSYIKIVKDKSILRRLISSSTEIIEKSYENQDDVAGMLDFSEKKIFNIVEKKDSSDFESMNKILEKGFVELERLFNNKDQITGVPSWFLELDSKTSGFQKGDMVLIAARPSMGKSTFALNIAEHVALRANKSVAIFSLEMSKEQLAFKLLCAEANIDMLKLRTGDINDKDWEKIARVSGPLANAKIFIDDTAGISIMELRSKCRRLKMKYGLDMVVIDYLQLMSGSRFSESRQQEVSEISRAIKVLAKEIECPIIALSQLSRAPEQRTDHRPMLSDLRESGSIEQDADIVMFLYRDEYYNKETEDKNIAECIIAKQRNGPTGTVKLLWLGQYSKFENLDIVHQE